MLATCTPAEPEPDVVRSPAAEVASGAADPDEASPVVPADPDTPTVLFLGTSLTAGYGLDDPDDAYPARIQREIDAAGLEFQVLNGGVSGDTSAGGLARLEWYLDRRIRVLVLELGANDGLRGQDTDALRDNLREIIRLTREKHPDVEVVLAGMEAPPNLGERYANQFRAVYAEVANVDGTELIPFLLDGVAGESELNQEDGIHPTAEGHEIVAALVWDVLEGVLRRVRLAG